MARVTPTDFYDDSSKLTTLGSHHGFLRQMRVHGEATNGFWWEGEYVHPRGIVSVYRQSDYTRLSFAIDGRLFTRGWEKYFGDRTIGQLARAFVADLTNDDEAKRRSCNQHDPSHAFGGPMEAGRLPFRHRRHSGYARSRFPSPPFGECQLSQEESEMTLEEMDATQAVIDEGVQRYIDQMGKPETLEQATQERNAWVASAAQFSRNEDYYRGLVDRIAVAIGPEAFTADDGTVYDEPVRDKVPELVEARLR